MRADRHRVICASNDHKDLTARIERLMHELHALARCGALCVGAADGADAAGSGLSKGLW